MGFNPFSKKSWDKAVDDTKKAVVDPVVKETTKVVDTVVKETTKVVDTAVKETTKVVDTAVKETTKAVNVAGKCIVDTTGKVTAEGEKFAKDTVNTIQKTTVSAANQVKVQATKDAMATAKVANAAMNDIEAGSKLAVKGLEQGAYAVKDAGELIAAWVEENYCQIGVSVALGTIFAAILYRPEPSSVATTTAATAPLSATAIMYLAAKETVGAVALGTACDLTASAFVDLIWVAPDVAKAIGSKNKQLLKDGIAFTLAKSIDVSAGAMIIPQSCAAVVAGVVTTLVAQLACEHTLPNGAREWATTGAGGL
jgi:hypothetical protein